jgi:hypothetical protein
MDNNDRHIGEVYAAWKARNENGSQLHPDDETLVCFIDGLLPPGQERTVRQHILTCRICASQLRAHLVFQPPAEDPPAELLEKTRKLLEQRLGLSMLELVVRAKDQLLQILSTSADVLVGQELVPAVLFRSRQEKAFMDSLTVLKDFKDIRVELQLRKKGGKFAVSAAVKDKATQKPLPGLRICLLQGDKELESYAAETGKADFEQLHAGKYTIEVSSPKEMHAVLFLEIIA